IEGREMAKFVFTRNLSAALDAIVEFGAEHGLSRDQLSHLTIEDLLAFRTGAPCAEPAAWLRARSDEGALWHCVMQMVELPPLIHDLGCFRAFERPTWQPNYVGDGSVLGDVVDLAESAEAGGPDGAVAGRIVLVPRADPGHDWLFGCGILGLITM